MEVYVPFNTPIRQNISGNSGFSLDPHNLTRCNARDITMNGLKTCFTEFLNIQDNQKSTSGFCLSSNKNDIDDVVEEDGHKDSNKSISSSLASEKLTHNCAIFPPPGELEASLEEMFGGKEMQESDVTAELLEANASAKQSLPIPVKLVSAMKGSRVKQGIATEKLSVTWAPDVYDPVPSSVSHFPSYNNQHYHSNGKRHGKNKQKSGSKSVRGSKGKDKKQTRKNCGNANKFKHV